MDDNSENQKQNIDIEHKIKLYLEQMSDDEKIVLEIAKQQLKSSFNLKKSIGFIEFCQNNNL
jgi:hypothetical protein